MFKRSTTLLAGALLVVAATVAASENLSDAQARYHADRAACMSGASNENRATCLREAGAALQEAKRGRLRDGDASQYEQNRLIRCNPLPQEDRGDCVRRMHGEGTTQGSAQTGGSFTELVTPVAPSGSN